MREVRIEEREINTDSDGERHNSASEDTSLYRELLDKMSKIEENVRYRNRKDWSRDKSYDDRRDYGRQ